MAFVAPVLVVPRAAFAAPQPVLAKRSVQIKKDLATAKITFVAPKPMTATRVFVAAELPSSKTPGPLDNCPTTGTSFDDRTDWGMGAQEEGLSRTDNIPPERLPRTPQTSRQTRTDWAHVDDEGEDKDYNTANEGLW
eukprot:tig00021517_g21996.t1